MVTWAFTELTATALATDINPLSIDLTVSSPPPTQNALSISRPGGQPQEHFVSAYTYRFEFPELPAASADLGHIYFKMTARALGQPLVIAGVSDLYAGLSFEIRPVGGTSLYDNWRQSAGTSVQLGPVYAGTATSFTTYNIYYLNSTSSVIDPAVVDGNWGDLSSNSYDSLRGTGLDVTVFADPIGPMEAGQAWHDFFEVTDLTMVVAYPEPVVAPPVAASGARWSVGAR